MKRRNMILVLVLGVVVLAALALSLSGWSPITLAGMVLNTFRTANSPAGTLVVELRESSPVTAIGTTGAGDTSSRSNPEPFDGGGWPRHNRTPTPQRAAPP